MQLSVAFSGVLADSINDASSTRKVYLLAIGLALLGVILIVITVWFWRTTRHDPEVLGPLEAMGTRRFRSVDDGSKQQLLDSARPAEAQPMKWGVVRGAATEQSDVELASAGGEGPEDFDDLREPVADSDELSPPDLKPTDAEAIKTVIGAEPEVDSHEELSAEPVVDAAAEDSLAEADDSAAVVEPLAQPVDEAAPEPVPALVIAPLDVDLRPTDLAALDGASNGEHVDHVDARADVDVDDHIDAGDSSESSSGVAIDPLLRRLERRD